MKILKKSLFLACALLVATHASSKVLTSTQTIKMMKEDLGNLGVFPKASSVLKKILLEYQEAKTNNVSSTSFSLSIPFTRTADGKLLVEISTYGSAEHVLESLKALGLTHGAVFYKQISGYIPFDKIEALLEHQGVKFVRPSMSMTHVGITTTQGDQAQESDEARIAFNVDGTGVRVATISDSIDAVTMPTSLADDIASGDLPNGIIQLPPSVPVPPGFGTDEGRAMMQIVHDIAPGASLYFRTGSLGEADFAVGITELVKAGVHIINDDVLNFSEPWFQDGIIAAAAASAVDQGVHFFSAAANQDEKSYQAGFTHSAIAPPTAVMGPSLVGVLHDFNPTGVDDPFQPFTLGIGETILILFQWSQPFESACQGDCPGPTTNLDIALFDPTNMVYVAGSAEDNIASGSALEIMAYQNTTGSPQNLHFMIANANNGPDPTLIKYIIPEGPVATLYHTKSSTLVGHANANNVIAVAASAFFFTPEFGQDPPLVNDSSSRGGTPILFDYRNRVLATPLIRQNPDITAPDGGNTTFFGDDIVNPADLDTFPNFFGTSAATPHVAGLAALMLDYAPRPSAISTDDMELILEQTAIDIVEDSLGNPLADGFDFKSGFGLVEAAGPNGAVCGDIDNDSFCINEDECPTDSNKTDTGACGCGRAETSCHGRGGKTLGSYPVFTLPLIGFDDTMVIEQPPVITPVALPEVEDVKPVVVDASTVTRLASSSATGGEPSEPSTTRSSCSSRTTSSYDLFVLLGVIYYLGQRRKPCGASK